jgi:hypothetical protein
MTAAPVTEERSTGWTGRLRDRLISVQTLPLIFAGFYAYYA